jgi:F0F1-type ATP synthase assembly protein I
VRGRGFYQGGAEPGPIKGQEIIMKNGKDKDSVYGDLGKYMGISFEMLTSVAVFCAIGYIVDNHWQTWPIGIISGTLLGVVVGFYLVIKDLFQSGRNLWKDAEDEDKKSGSDQD